MIAKKTWREVRAMAVVYTLVLQVMLTPAILLWPELRDKIPAIGTLFPMQMIRDLFAAMSVPDDRAAYRAYVAVQLFFKGVNVVGLACAVLLGTGMIARERENHTLEFLLARPVARARVLWSKTWVIAACLVVPIFVTSYSAIPLSWSIGYDLPFVPLTLACAYSSLFVLVFFAFTALASVLCRTQVHVAFVVGVTVILQVGLLFLPSVHVASVFHLSDFEVYGPILAGNLQAWPLLKTRGVWLLLAIAVQYALAQRLFRRLDL